jgi:hypothetical protein
MNHVFTETILSILRSRFGDNANLIFDNSALLQYLNIKTRSANRGSKARGAFANHYALYVLIEDYVKNGFANARKGQYSTYEGARFTHLLRRQHELPFGAKLQNHALNSRVNDEFTKFFPTIDVRPVVRDQQAQRYWINEQLLLVKVSSAGEEQSYNIAQTVIDIIDAYVRSKISAFENFLAASRQIALLPGVNKEAAIDFIRKQLHPNVDARIFEIVSFAILKAHYGEFSVYWGWTLEDIHEEYLVLFKTGRTNANDGGIDYVMKPLGRFFQVTETVNVNKYFLDIDKIQRFPLTFVVKTDDSSEMVRRELQEQARRKYGVDAIVERYMQSIEEIINTSMLVEMFEKLVRKGQLEKIMSEIILQSRAEFNLEDEETER